MEVEIGSREGRFDKIRAGEFHVGLTPTDLGSDKVASKGKKKDAQTMAEQDDISKPLQRVTLRGETVPDQTNYCVAVIKDRESVSSDFESSTDDEQDNCT